MKKFIVSLTLLGCSVSARWPSSGMTMTSRLRAKRSKGVAIAVGMTAATGITATTAGADVAAITAVMTTAGTTDVATKGMDAVPANMTVARWTAATSAASCVRSAPNGATTIGKTTFTSVNKKEELSRRITPFSCPFAAKRQAAVSSRWQPP